MSHTPAAGTPLPALERPTTPADAKHLYIAFLGRVPENRTRVSDMSGRPLRDTLREIAGSGEFEDIVTQIAENGSLPSRGKIPDRDLEGTGEWLQALTGAQDGRSLTHWPEFLLTILEWDQFIALAPEHPGADEAVRRLNEMQALGAEMDGGLSEAVAFDPEWFAQTAAGRRFAPGADTGAALGRKGGLPPVLAFFTEGLEILEGRGRPNTLSQLIRSTQKAARDGVLAHWLWNEEFYQWAADRSGAIDPTDSASALAPYLEFLTLGDRADVAPHMLFSPFAYRHFNPDAEIGADGCFHHYVEQGVREERRTSALFEPEYYLARQPHVRQEIAAGRYSSALEHFIRVGLNAGYAFSPDFNRHHYLTESPDVAKALTEGAIPSAEWHFVERGVREGRSPNPFFNSEYYLKRYPSAEDEMEEHGIASSLEHFLLLGRARGWRVNHPPVMRDVDIDQSKALFEKRGRRAYAEALAGVFAFDAAPATPRLSVIAPVSGQADFTAGFLKCARWAADHLEHKRGVTTEIIIVDNGSKDHTARLLQALPGVRLVAFDKPIGFPAAVNAGAAVALGDIVVVANNDIEFQADAFLRIVDALDQHPEAGVVGAKIVLPNEKLQEVGSVLDKDGSSHGLGRGLDAVDCVGARMIEVDYASGCFIGVRKSDYDALGGLDEAYSPGYYEEVDFSIRMKRDLAKTTVVDTGLAITHYEHASFAKGRPQTVNEPLILRNRVRIKSSHAEFFAGLDNTTLRSRAEMIRDSMSGGARLLVVEDFVPSSLLGSGFCREEEILDVFTAAGVPFDIVALNPSSRVDEYKNPLTRLYRNWVPGERLDTVLDDHGHKYSHIWLCRTHNLNRATEAIQRVKAQYGTKVVCDTEAIASLRVAEQLAMQNRRPSEAELRALISAELSDPVGVDLWVAVNQRDREYIESVGVGPVCEIGHAVTFQGDAGQAADFKSRSRITFIGAVHELSSPNYDSLNWFLSEVLPRLQPASDYQISVVGYWADGLDQHFKSQFAGLNIDFVGAVSQARLAEIYRESRLTIAPTRFAAGVPFKVMESVMAGVPVVMTDMLADQFGLANEGGLAAAPRDDGGAEFARLIESLYYQEKAWLAQRKLQDKLIGSVSTLAKLEGEVKDAARMVGILR